MTAPYPSLIGRVCLLAVCGLACKSERPGTQEGPASVGPPHVFRQFPESTKTTPSTDTATWLVISPDRIGPIPVDSSMGYVARLLPTFTADSSYLETTPIVGWDFNVGGFSVWASQQYSQMNLELPAVTWIVRGSGTVLLPSRVPIRLPTLWRDLRNRVSGRVSIESGEIGTRARFCALPRLAFPLDVGLSDAATNSLYPDSIAPATPVSAIEVWPGDTPCAQ
jgi:hypothetical protein